MKNSSLNIDIDQYGNRSVVPIRCGRNRGTAFFVGSNQLLTAKHIIGPHINNPTGCKIQVSINDKWYECNVSFKSTVADVVLLNCSIAEPNGYKLEIVSSDCPSGEDLLVFGFPEEIGNGIDYFGVRVRNSRHLRKDNKDDLSRGFNVVVVRTDLLEFASYSGFSGSPVLNSKSEVVGIATDQFYNSLGYTSIRMLVDEFNFSESGIDVKRSDIDTTQFGITKAADLLQEKLKKAGERYSPKTHVDDVRTNDFLTAFCQIGLNKEREQVLSLCQQIYNKADEELKTYLDKKNKDGNDKKLKNLITVSDLGDELLNELDDIQYYTPEHSDEYALKNPLRKNVEKAYALLQHLLDFEYIEQSRFLYVTGSAGQGKTHTLCRFADINSDNCLFYLFYGTEFGEKEPIDSILSSLQWVDGDLAKLNDYVNRKNQYAIFIIDAINEGNGTEYWKTGIGTLKSSFEKYNRIKLILSFRTMPETDELKELLTEFVHLEIGGFKNTREAIKIFFDKMEINEDSSVYASYPEFQSPLYLKIFCEAYHLLPNRKKDKHSRDKIYSAYLRKRNVGISASVDEDPTEQVTWRYVKELAQSSVEEALCFDIPREEALEKANQICKDRLWSHNLMNILLKENILKEYTLKNGRRIIGFEFDSMGDYLKMCHLKNKPDQLITDYIMHALTVIVQNNRRMLERSHFSNVLTYLLSEWNPSETVLKNLTKHKILTKYFIRSISLRKGNDDYSKKLAPIIEDIIQEEPIYSSPDYLIDNFDTYKYGVIDKVHEFLLSKKLSERDLTWTFAVNELYNRYGAMSRINSLFDTQVEYGKQLAILISWLCTTSHPSFHAQLVMVMRDIFIRDLSLIKITAESFETVNDPYVNQGIFAAGYAALVLKRDVERCKEVSTYLIETYYSNKKDTPSDVVVRNWTLKIIELTKILDDTFDGWDNVLNLMPFDLGENPFDGLNNEEIRKDDYLGNTAGACSIRRSLFEWDFYRYILGANNNIYSPVFASNDRPIDEINNIHTEGDVKIDDIANAIAKLIRDKYNYPEELSKIDKSLYEGRYNNEKERIGKKYQWIGYFEVLSYLCDHYNIVLERWGANPRYAEKALPWLTGDIPHFDPTIGIEESLSVISAKLFDCIDNDIITIDNPEVWMADVNLMPSMNIILKDNKKEEWVFLSAFDKQTVVANNMKCSMRVWYNTVMVSNDKQEQFENWCNENGNYRQDFYSDSEYEYQWNDYPCSSAYKDRSHPTKHDWSCHCDIIKTTTAQLQEEFTGCISPSEFIRESEAPNNEMMGVLKLHTAERGVVRDESDDIVAININSTSDRMSGLVIKRDVLNKYINDKSYKLYYFVTVDNNVFSDSDVIGDKWFNAVWRYEHDTQPVDVVPLTLSVG